MLYAVEAWVSRGQDGGFWVWAQYTPVELAVALDIQQEREYQGGWSCRTVTIEYARQRLEAESWRLESPHE